jgi:hypothetical protein
MRVHFGLALDLDWLSFKEVLDVRIFFLFFFFNVHDYDLDCLVIILIEAMRISDVAH